MTSSPEIPSKSSFSIPEGVELSFPEWDVLVAKAVVRKLIRAGIRKGPSDLLVLEDSAYEAWLREDALEFLREQKAARQAVVAEME